MDTRDECLNEHWFSTLHEARILIEAWRKDYNSIWPHSSLGNTRQPNLQPNTHLQPRILLRRVANYGEQVTSYSGEAVTCFITIKSNLADLVTLDSEIIRSRELTPKSTKK